MQTFVQLVGTGFQIVSAINSFHSVNVNDQAIQVSSSSNTPYNGNAGSNLINGGGGGGGGDDRSGGGGGPLVPIGHFPPGSFSVVYGRPTVEKLQYNLHQ